MRNLSLRLATLAVGLATTSTALAETEVVTFAATLFAKTNGSAYCCSGCDDLSQPPTDASKFLEGGFAAYTQKKSWSGAAVDGRDFTDATQFSWGTDSNDDAGTDFADVIFYSGHGSYNSASQYTYVVMGDNNSGETCSPRIADDTAASRHMEFGNGGSGEEADALVFFACNTAQYEAWMAGSYHQLSAAGGQFNILNGFHGIVWEVSGYQTDLKNYAADAINNGIGDAWLDRMYDPRSGANTSNCPISIGWGADSSQTGDYYMNAGWADFHDNGARGWSHMYYICGCDPDSGQAIPTC